MIRFLALTALACFVPPLLAAEPAKPVKVFILAGQSNMEGKAKLPLLEHQAKQPGTAELYQHLRQDDKWVERDDVWIKFLDRKGRLTAGYGSPGCIGPELEFGAVVGEAYAQQVLLIKTAWGGRSLFRDFRPPSAGLPAAAVLEKMLADQRKRTPQTTLEAVKGQFGASYRAMLDEVGGTLRDLKKHFPDYAGQGHELAGFIWFQGWNDMIDPSYTAEYANNLAHLIRDVRKDLRAPGLPFVIGQMGVDGDKANDGVKKFKAAQAAVMDLPEFQGNVSLVRTDAFWDQEADAVFRRGWRQHLEEWNKVGSDYPYHYLGSPKTLCKIGRAFAKAALELESKKWIEPMRKVHARFRGTPGTFAHFGDSITVSMAFWAPLAHEPKGLDAAAAKALARVKAYQHADCWRKWKGASYGNDGGMTIRWAHENVERWLKRLNPEVVLLMFGTNDLGQLEEKEYVAKTREVVQRCLDNGSVVILSTIPPRSGLLDKSRRFADAVKGLGAELGVPVVDYFGEVLRRRPDDWDGSLAKFKDSPGDEYQVPTLIARDGVHPSNPRAYQNYDDEGLKHNGFVLRNYLVLRAYAETIDHVLRPDDAKKEEGNKPGATSKASKRSDPPWLRGLEERVAAALQSKADARAIEDIRGELLRHLEREDARDAVLTCVALLLRLPPKAEAQPPPPTFPFTRDAARRYQEEYAAWRGLPVKFAAPAAGTFVLVPPGKFVMGSPASEPGHGSGGYDERQHEVTLTRPFYLGQCEVTVGQFRRFVEATGHVTDGEKNGGGHAHDSKAVWVHRPGTQWRKPGYAGPFEQRAEQPVVHVSHRDSLAFCRWLQELVGARGLTCDLPTEAQWEWSCRAGSGERYWWGAEEDASGKVANVGDRSLKRVHPEWPRQTMPMDDGHAFVAPVGTYQANAFGLHDMLGNVWEFCSTRYGPYSRTAVTDPGDLDPKRGFAVRGGGWSNVAADCRSGTRNADPPTFCHSNLGFRVALR
jgi:alpha-galactosidase